MKTVGRGWGLTVCLWAAVAWAEPAQEPLVLRVFNDFFTASELGLSPQAVECRDLEPLIKGVVGPLFTEYCDKNGVSVGEEDLKDYCRRQLSDKSLFVETWAEWTPTGNLRKARQQAIVELTLWKLQKSLFEKYGGRVSLGEWTPPQAFDALFAYVAEREKAGDFTIHDERLKMRFWKCLRTPKDPLVPEDEGRSALAEHPVDRQKRRQQVEP